uniref:Uncharacterized protein n=1 Tax=Arundo donax TaxID=35708 RepID=A0A0A8ZR89_ARUDO
MIVACCFPHQYISLSCQMRRRFWSGTYLLHLQWLELELDATFTMLCSTATVISVHSRGDPNFVTQYFIICFFRERYFIICSLSHEGSSLWFITHHMFTSTFLCNLYV